MAQEDEPKAEDIARVQAWLDSEQERNSGLEERSYDGVLGLPPDWVPEPVIERFRRFRSRVLDDWKYTPEHAAQWIGRYTRIGEVNDDWFFPGRHPNGRELEPKDFLETIGFLAHLKYASHLGSKEGLKILAGEDAASGRSSREAGSRSKRSRISVVQEAIDKAVQALKAEESKGVTEKVVWQYLEQHFPSHSPYETVEGNSVYIDGEKLYWTLYVDEKNTKLGELKHLSEYIAQAKEKHGIPRASRRKRP